jgi:hypothetical protein
MRSVGSLSWRKRSGAAQCGEPVDEKANSAPILPGLAFAERSATQNPTTTANTVVAARTRRLQNPIMPIARP